MALDPNSPTESLSAAAQRARERLHTGRGLDCELVFVARAMLGNRDAEKALAAAERYARTGGISGKRDRKSGGGFATCGRCGSILPGDQHCKQCGHISLNDHHGDVRRPKW